LDILVFVDGGKRENLEKNLQGKVRTNSTFNPHDALGWNQTLATLVGGERSHYCAIPAPNTMVLFHTFY